MRRCAVVPLVLLAAACGGGDDGSVLADAEEHLTGITQADLTLELTASTPTSGPVGFRLEGPFDFDSGGDVPVLDLTYTRLLGDEEQAVRVVSDGESVTVEQDGADPVEVPDDELDALRLGDGGAAGLEDLDLADWVEDPEETEDGATTTVRGELDAAALLQDLNRIVAGVAGAEGLAQLEGDAADELASHVQESTIEVVTEGDDHRLRSLDAAIDFGRDVPEGLEEALGPYAAARLQLSLALS